MGHSCTSMYGGHTKSKRRYAHVFAALAACVRHFCKYRKVNTPYRCKVKPTHGWHIGSKTKHVR